MPVRVILADDDDGFRSLLVTYFARVFPAAVVEIASNGRDALDHYDTAGADLVLLDCRMPVVNGLAVAAALRARNAQIPIIILSVEDWYAQAAVAAGATHFVNKAEAISMLDRILSALLVA